MKQHTPTAGARVTGRWLLGVALALGATACVDSTVEPEYARALAEEAATTTTTSEQTVEVNTRFVVEGLDEIATRVQLDRLYVHVGALVLEPIAEDAVSFASREPFALEFDLERGETSIAGPTMTLPYGGEFAVVVQVEPTEVERSSGKTSSEAASVEAEGRWFYSDAFDGVSPRSDEPSPLPWREAEDKRNGDDAPGRTFLQQRDFTYRAADVARLHLTEIRLDEAGEYELTLTLRVDGWLERDVLPVLAELETDVREPREAEVPDFQTPDGDEEELDRVIDGNVVALDGLVGDIEATTARR